MGKCGLASSRITTGGVPFLVSLWLIFRQANRNIGQLVGEVVALRLDPIQGGRGGVCVGGLRWLGISP
jgi:hypothetical protein